MRINTISAYETTAEKFFGALESWDVDLLLDKLAPIFVTALTPAPLRPSSSAWRSPSKSSSS